MFRFPLLIWELPYAPGYKVFKLLGGRIPLLSLDQLHQFVRKPDAPDIVLFPIRSPPSDSCLVPDIGGATVPFQFSGIGALHDSYLPM